jgi:hypothetical protein
MAKTLAPGGNIGSSSRENDKRGSRARTDSMGVWSRGRLFFPLVKVDDVIKGDGHRIFPFRARKLLIEMPGLYGIMLTLYFNSVIQSVRPMLWDR